VKTTKRHFDIFRKESQKWIKEFGLLDWWVQYSHEDIGDGAQCRYSYTYKMATLVLSTVFDQDYPATTHKIKRMAFHEVYELVLAEMNTLITSRVYDKEEADRARHAVIRRMENVFFK
jgi:hypothetical protein